MAAIRLFSQNGSNPIFLTKWQQSDISHKMAAISIFFPPCSQQLVFVYDYFKITVSIIVLKSRATVPLTGLSREM
jgi:hypothetical protein